MEQNFDIEDIVINLYLEALQERKQNQNLEASADDEFRYISNEKFEAAAAILAEEEWLH